MAAATYTNSAKENVGSVSMVRKVASSTSTDIVFDISVSKVKAFTADDFGLKTIVGGFVTTNDTFPISLMVTSTGCSIETAATADVLVSDDVAITVFGK